MTDRFTHDAAPYVLGALSPEDRRAFEEHLAGCPECQAEVREFAGLPGLLSRLPAAEVPQLVAAERVPDPDMMPALLSRARRERRVRRWRALAVGAVAACLAAVGAGVAVEVIDQERAAAVHAFERVIVQAPVSAEATLSDVPGGTRIDMTCRYSGTLEGRTVEYTLRAVSRSGTPVPLGSWPLLSTDEYRVTAVVPLPRDKIDHFDVVTASDRVLLTLTL